MSLFTICLVVTVASIKAGIGITNFVFGSIDKHFEKKSK